MKPASAQSLSCDETQPVDSGFASSEQMYSKYPRRKAKMVFVTSGPLGFQKSSVKSRPSELSTLPNKRRSAKFTRVFASQVCVGFDCKYLMSNRTDVHTPYIHRRLRRNRWSNT